MNLKPYDELWSLTAAFSANMTAWLKDGSVFKLNPEEIEREMKMMF